MKERTQVDSAWLCQGCVDHAIDKVLEVGKPTLGPRNPVRMKCHRCAKLDATHFVAVFAPHGSRG